jgi:hypothetical protein
MSIFQRGEVCWIQLQDLDPDYRTAIWASGKPRPGCC